MNEDLIEEARKGRREIRLMRLKVARVPRLLRRPVRAVMRFCDRLFRFVEENARDARC